MQYRRLGRTDINVSLICLGSMTWGEQNTQDEAFDQLDYALDQGINFVDLAEMYPVPPRPETAGKTEAIMGHWLAKRGGRDKLIIASKVTGRSSNNTGLDHIRGGARLNAQQIKSALDDSLKRLQTDYIDLYQVHWPERQTNFFGALGYEPGGDDGIPIKETLSALDDLVTSGKVRHIGISNETPWGMMQYLSLSEQNTKARIVSIQNPYSLLNRSFEIGAAEISMREDVSMLGYSPLAFGKLSGKYLNGAKPKGARLTLYERFSRYDKTNADAATAAYVDLAREHQLDPAQMALAFVNQQPFVSSNIIGATSMQQLKMNIGSADIELSNEALSGIEAIHARFPNPCP